MSDFTYSTSLFPLVIMTCPSRFEAAEVKSVLERYNRDVFESRRKFAVVIDTMNVSELPTALVRRTITDWMKTSEDLGARYMQGMALASSSAIVRGAMTAVNWVVPPRVPMVYEASLEAAVTWAIAKLDETGVGSTPAMRAYRDSLRRAAS